MRYLAKRLWSMMRGGRLDRELHDEIEVHLAMQEEEFRRAGMAPQAARDAARREFGGVVQTQELYRERRGIPWIESSAADVRYAVRGLSNHPGFAAAAVFSLALGIGANTAVFSMFYSLMLRMLPVSKPAELINLVRTGAWGRGSSYPLYLEVRKRSDLFQGVVARSAVEKVRLGAGSSDRPETIQREFATGNYFAVLGIPPAAGRVFGDEDDRTPHARPVAVLSYDFWRTRFAADPAIVGRTLIVDSQPLTVIGVAARGFRGVEVEHHPDVWVPTMMAPGEIMEPGLHWIYLMARRRPEVSRRQAQAAMDVLMKQYLATVYGAHTNAAFRRTAMAQQIEVKEGAVGLSLLRDQFGEPLTVLMGAVGLVLLAACANVANLLLARGAARLKEVALRVSLGATRGRLVRQALTESLLLAGAGAVLGVLFALWGSRVILGFLPASAGEPFTVAPDASVLAFTLGLSVFSALLFGLAPAIRSTAVDPSATLQLGMRESEAHQPALRKALVAAQVAFSVVLVVLAGLFGHSLSALRSVDLGFHNRSLLAFTLDFPSSWKPADAKAARRRLLEQLETLPGVSLVSFGFPGPFLGGSSSSSVRVVGSTAPVKEGSWVSVHVVGPRYFEAIDSPPVAGREIDRNDVAGGRRVALVNEAFVREYLGGEGRPLERQIETGIAPGGPVFIIGVVRDMAHKGLRKKADPTVYLPAAQSTDNWEPTILVRSALPPERLAPAIRRESARLSPQIAASEPKTIGQHIDESIFRERLLATLGGFFGLLALALASIGLYGVMSYGTARRAREIGIRIALGARRGEVLWMVLRDALLLVGLGLALGLPFSFAAAKKVTAVLFGVQPADAATFAITAGVLAAIGLAAAFLPARRAAAMDPMRVLRME